MTTRCESPSRTNCPAHSVQVYEADEALLVDNVARYVREGLAGGAAVFVVATPRRREQLTQCFDAATIDDAIADGRLSSLDAEQTLARFMRAPTVKWSACFGSAASAARRCAWKRSGTGSSPPAVSSCSAAIRSTSSDRRSAATTSRRCSAVPPHVVPAAAPLALRRALERALQEVDGAGSAARTAAPALPNAEAAIAWLRRNDPDAAPAIAARAREHYARARLRLPGT